VGRALRIENSAVTCVRGMEWRDDTEVLEERRLVDLETNSDSSR
jgi:hypothetical protein